MSLLEREHLLHKVLAGSAFVFSLSLLPIAHYYLTGASGQSEQAGMVLGASTERPAALADVPAASGTPETAAQCALAKQAQLNQLDSWLQENQQSDISDYDKQTASLVGDQAKLDAAYAAYLKRVAAQESAVESQKNAVESAACPAE